MASRSIDNPLETLVGYQLRRVSAAAMGTLGRELAQFGLSATEGSVLLLIGANAGITQSEIGRVLAIKRANMTPLAAALDRRGLVERQPVNGRSHGLVLSREGDAIAARIDAAMRRHDTEMLRHLPPEAQAMLVETLRRMQRDLSQEDTGR